MSAPPPPPPPPDNDVSGTPKLYMTPHLAKRKDGLAPSLMVSGAKADNGATSNTKIYKTTTALIQDPEELQAVVDSITATLERLVDRDTNKKDLNSLYFQPAGCQWIMHFNPSLRANDYHIEVTCSAADSDHITQFAIETKLCYKSGEAKNDPTSQPYRDAKGTFEYTALQVRKAVVKCEFPEFPEGCKGRPFKEVYQLNARLKSGSFATVCRGTHRATGNKVAIKCVLRKDLPPADDAAIYDEVAILASLTHPNIVPLIDFFDEKDCYFLVMELMSGGDLFDRIGKKKAYSEADARDLCHKMIKAVSYCHNQKIAHCDMKPKNLLLMSDDNDSFIKLADFGFAARVHVPKSLTKQCGTPFFVSPEILMRQPYDEMSDMWSVGCIVFLLLSGNLPFMGRSQKELFRKIVSGKYNFNQDDWCDVSDDAKDLVRKLLVLDPDNRFTAGQALRHRWLMASQDRLQRHLLRATSQRLSTFNARMKLRSAMIAVDWVSSLKRTTFLAGKSSNAGGTSIPTMNNNAPPPLNEKGEHNDGLTMENEEDK